MKTNAEQKIQEAIRICNEFGVKFSRELQIPIDFNASDIGGYDYSKKGRFNVYPSASIGEKRIHG